MPEGSPNDIGRSFEQKTLSGRLIHPTFSYCMDGNERQEEMCRVGKGRFLAVPTVTDVYGWESMLRKATELDIPSLITIEQATQLAPWTEEIFDRCFKMKCDCWVIEEDDHVIAFLMMTSSVTRESHILNLCVESFYQRKGHGQKLLNYALSQAKHHGIEIIYLEVRRSNHNAIMLYHKAGFIQVGERKDYYPTENGREDALVFAIDCQINAG